MVDDYGHHPTEIRATLDGARQCGFRRIHVLFQPHRFTRTFHLMDEFARAFHQADSVFVMDIYAASEKPIEGVTAEALVERLRQFGHRGAEYVGTLLWPSEGPHRTLSRRRIRGNSGSRSGGAGRGRARWRCGTHAGRGQCLAGRREVAGKAAYKSGELRWPGKLRRRPDGRGGARG